MEGCEAHELGEALTPARLRLLEGGGQNSCGETWLSGVAGAYVSKHRAGAMLVAFGFL